MISLHRLLATLLLTLSTSLSVDAEVLNNQNKTITENLIFIPPAGWRNAEKSALPNQVELMVVGKGTHEFPPSLSLATENYTGSVKDYLIIVKKLNASKGHEWKDLGEINTKAGKASFSQTDSKSEWGDIRMMHVILKKNETIYILTAAALKEEFPKFYKEIFASLKSIQFSQLTSEKN